MFTSGYQGCLPIPGTVDTIHHILSPKYLARAGIFKLLRSSGIDSKEPILPAYVAHTARIPSPLPLRVATAGRNNLKEEFTPLLPTGIGERF